MIDHCLYCKNKFKINNLKIYNYTIQSSLSGKQCGALNQDHKFSFFYNENNLYILNFDINNKNYWWDLINKKFQFNFQNVTYIQPNLSNFQETIIKINKLIIFI